MNFHVPVQSSRNIRPHVPFQVVQIHFQLENGQYALYPNNRLRIFDNSLTPVDPKMPDFKVSTQYYQVENGFERLGMGREDEYFWKTAQERENSSEEGEK